MERYLASLYERFRSLDDGVVASYIPEIAKADRSSFAICVATVDGHVYEVGESRIPFTIQSISKPFAYGLALEDRGKQAVLERIGVEPTGDAFNEISLEADTGRPFNPMINAGAITATSLVAGRSHADKWSRILGLFSIYAGRQLELNEVVYESERETGHRNRAIGHMLRNFGILEEDPEGPLNLYFRQCSVEVSCRDLSVMAATLATGGVNPITRERALDPTHVDEVLSVMTTCGMYDYAGEWLYRVGLPAKSGVTGGILAVLPGQLGIAVYSPPLDARGNSARGVAVCEAMSEELGLHSLQAPRACLSVVRSRFSLREIGSKRRRTDPERRILADSGRSAVVYQLQGDIAFAAAELAVRRIAEGSPDAAYVLLDLARVIDFDASAARILLELLRGFAAKGRVLGLVGLHRLPRLQRFLAEQVCQENSVRLVEFQELDGALEWCEDQLLAGQGFSRAGARELSLAEHEFARGLDAAELDLLARAMRRREFAARELLVRKGEPADALYLLVQGELSVLVDAQDGRLHRLATLSPGMGFGEASLADEATRTAFVRADRPAVCWVLERSAYVSLDGPGRTVQVKLLENLLRSTSGIVARLTREAIAAGS